MEAAVDRYLLEKENNLTIIVDLHDVQFDLFKGIKNAQCNLLAVALRQVTVLEVIQLSADEVIEELCIRVEASGPLFRGFLEPLRRTFLLALVALEIVVVHDTDLDCSEQLVKLRTNAALVEALLLLLELGLGPLRMTLRQ